MLTSCDGVKPRAAANKPKEYAGAAVILCPKCNTNSSSELKGPKELWNKPKIQSDTNYLTAA